MTFPWRTGMPDRPDVAFDRVLHGGRPLKRWRWVGIFGPDVMLCVGCAHVGPVPTGWWAIWDRGERTLIEQTVRRAVPTPDGETGTPVETISLHDGRPIWTRKTPATFSGRVRVAGRELTLDGVPGLIDESAGYHARHTDWRWSAGVGTAADGRPVAWNLVTGLHDDPAASERTVWVDGVPHHLGPQPFADDLSRVGDLRFEAEATRVHRENALLVATDYEQPFGAFAGTLGPAGPVTGLGVMERHSVRW